MTDMQETNREDRFHDSPVPTDGHDRQLIRKQITGLHAWNDMVVQDGRVRGGGFDEGHCWGDDFDVVTEGVEEDWVG